jgi:preprotein translocase subunit SecA
MFAALPDNEPLTQSSMLTRKVTGVQKQVEGHHFDSRKHVLEYDNVINKHREIIYRRRNNLLVNSENFEEITNIASEMIYARVRNIVLAEEAKM